MKKIIIALFIFFAKTATAQINITLTVNPRPMANISMWSTRADMLTLAATSQAGPSPTLQCKVNTTLLDASGTVLATTNLLKAAIKTIALGSTKIMYANEVVDLAAMELSTSILSKMNKSGQLPAGTYQIKVRLVNATQPVEVSNEQTKIFTIAPKVLPTLIKPLDGEELLQGVAQSAITFRWSPLFPKPVGEVYYRLNVFEVLQDQTPIQAVRANRAVFDKEVAGTTQFIWNPQLSFTDSAVKAYVWTVQTLDNQRQPVIGETAGSMGISEPKVFKIVAVSSKQKANKEKTN